MNFEFLEAIFNHLPIAVFVKDQDHRYVYANDEFVKHAGRLREAIIGKTDKEFQEQSVVDELGQGFIDSDKAVLQQGEVVETTFAYNIGGNKPTPILTRKSRMISPDGKAFVLGTCTDVSRVSDLEAINVRIGALNMELAEKVQELHLAQEEIIRRGKMAQLGQLTATVAHEIRNPLGAVKTSAFLLQRKLHGKNLGVEPQIERINTGVSRCDNIITQLLDFARSKKLDLQPANLDSWLVELVEHQAENLPVELSLHLELGLGETMIGFDKQRMGRAVINLLLNASEAMLGNGKEKPSVDTTNPRITVSSRKTERGAEIMIEDNGPGMTEDILARIREPLFTTKSFGTGLGIPAIEQIIEQHDGGLDIWSVSGEGSRFTLWWPTRSEVEAAA